MNNLVTRALTGIVYVAAIVLAVLYGTGWMVALCAIFAFFALHEFLTLTNAAQGGSHRLSTVVDLIGGVSIVVATGLITAYIGGAFGDSATADNAGLALFFIAIIYLLGRPIMQLYTLEKSPIVNLALTYMGICYVCMPLCALQLVRFVPVHGTYLTLAMFIMIWLSDTGAYCVGSLIGRHKLFPRISPAKSVEGFIGGVVFAAAAGMAMKAWCPAEWFGQMSMWALGGMGLVVAVFSTWGDLVESLIKRTLGIKDSGHILPGHGGMLDRIDSLLLAAPATFLYLCFFA